MKWGKNLYDLIRIPIKKPCKGYYLRWYYNGWHYWFFLPGDYSVNTEGEKYRTIGTRSINMSSGQIDRGQAKAIRTIMNTRKVYLFTVAGWMNIRITPGSLIVYDNRQQGIEIEFQVVIGSKDVSYDTGFTPVPGDGFLPEIPVVPPSTEYCESIIGTQIWMCKNWDADYPGSKAYDNNEANADTYGRLYTYAMIKSPGFCPVGWHVPTLSEWEELIDYVGGNLLAGRELKSIGTDYWLAPNGGLDTHGFGARGGGQYSTIFGFLREYGFFWTVTMAFGQGVAHVIRMGYASDATLDVALSRNNYYSVRLIKDVPAPPAVYDDWFLPSLDELEEIFLNLKMHGIGDLSDGIYWASNDIAYPPWGYYGRVYSFSGITGPNSSPKTSTFAVRACRKFISISIYSLRDIGPAGGWIFHIVDNGDGTYTYYECSPSDLSSMHVWSNIIASVPVEDTSISSGAQNTLDIINQAGHTDSAAKLCNDLVV